MTDSTAPQNKNLKSRTKNKSNKKIIQFKQIEVASKPKQESDPTNLEDDSNPLKITEEDTNLKDAQDQSDEKINENPNENFINPPFIEGTFVRPKRKSLQGSDTENSQEKKDLYENVTQN